MPMDFLSQIRDELFPLTLTDAGQINNAAVLQAAKLIEADIPEMIQGRGSDVEQPSAVIHKITRLGRIALDDRDKETRRKSKFSGHLRKRSSL